MRLPRIEAARFVIEPGLLGCCSRNPEAAGQARLRKQRIPVRFLGVAIALLAPLAALAQVTATSEYLARMDSDGDGRVGRAEYLDWMSYAFDARDANRDGVLTADELPGGKGQPITRTEHRERLSTRFDKQDVDHDGHLSARELAAPPQ